MIPDFSVVLPTRGDSPHLRSALASALANGERLELLLVHDRRDGEPALPPELRADPRVRPLEAAAPGPAAGRNTGIDAARGRYLAFLDDDDLWLPEHPGRLRDLLAGRPEALLAASDAYLFPDPSADGSGVPPPDGSGLARFRPRAGAAATVLSLRDLLLANPVLTPTVVLVREKLSAAERFREELDVMEDYELWLRLARRHVLLYDPRPSAVVRRRPASASGNLRGMAEQSLRVLDEQVALGLPPGTLNAAELRRRRGRLWHDLAHACLRDGDRAAARRAARRAAACLPLLGKNYIYLLLASILPAGHLRTLARARRRRSKDRRERADSRGDRTP